MSVYGPLYPLTTYCPTAIHRVATPPIPANRKSTWPVRFSQTIDDYIESLHARNGFSRDRMAPEAAAAFDAEVRALLEAHHPDGIIRGRNQAHVVWGRPRLPDR